jgi:hypothetical protein
VPRNPAEREHNSILTPFSFLIFFVVSSILKGSFHPGRWAVGLLDLVVGPRKEHMSIFLSNCRYLVGVSDVDRFIVVDFYLGVYEI